MLGISEWILTFICFAWVLSIGLLSGEVKL